MAAPGPDDVCVVQGGQLETFTTPMEVRWSRNRGGDWRRDGDSGHENKVSETLIALFF